MEKKISTISFLSIKPLTSSILAAESLDKKRWNATVYAFFTERPTVVRKDNKKRIRTTYLEFRCLKCQHPFLRDTGNNSGSTGAMWDHVPWCWGEDIWNKAKDLKLGPAKEIIGKAKVMKNVQLTEMFARAPNSKETFSLRPPTREQIRYALNTRNVSCVDH